MYLGQVKGIGRKQDEAMVLDGEVESRVGLAEDTEYMVSQRDSAFLLLPQIRPRWIEHPFRLLGEALSVAADGIDVEVSVRINSQNILQIHGSCTHHGWLSLSLSLSL